MNELERDRLRRNCCRYCGTSLELELDSDVLLNSGACSSCAEEEDERRRELDEERYGDANNDDEHPDEERP
jgi:hypothetical protein